ncbi:MAG: hypothetical protein K2Z25_01805 [Beijerinckiaceae bacterium]|nr:hypothetical protein [Beijerinckiaceae bacterium]
MGKLRVSLRDDQEAELEQLSRKTGQSPGDFIRHGVDLAIAEAKEAQPIAAAEENDDWKAAWRGIFGLWADRDDIDERRAKLRADNQQRDAELQRHWRGE